MAAKEFTLDFTGQSGVPSQWGIDLNLVLKWFGQQTRDSGVSSSIGIIDDRRRGVFRIIGMTQEASTFLSTFKLKAEKYGKQFEIPLRENRRGGKKGVWINLNGTCEGKLRNVPASYFGLFA